MAMINRVVDRIKDGTFVKRCVARLRRSGSNKIEVAGEPAGDSYYGDRAENYLATRLKQEYWHQEQEVFKEILSEFPSERRVLDVPFGTGRFVPFYLEKQMEIHGLDSSQDMVEVARRDLGADFAHCKVEIADAMALPYEDEYFDMLVSFRFLSHIVSAVQARLILREFHRVCREHLIVQLRVRRDDAPPIDPPKDGETLGDRLTYDQLEKELLNAGFRIERRWDLEERDTYFRTVLVCTRA
jgi:SAM-dependent methyltransferase